MKTITKFIFGLPMLALASGSIAFAQVPLTPLIPPDSALKAAAHPLLGGGDTVVERVTFKSGSTWFLTVNAVNKFGLVITGASFQKSPGSPFVYVLHDARMGEIFVPYHNNSHRYRDISYFGSFGPLELDKSDFPAPREIIGVDKLICKEVRDYLAWMTSNGAARYGQEVVYFGVLGAGNYAYIMEWTFRDDGTIQARAGSTGPKAGDVPEEGHMHNFTWRLDIDLNGAGANTAFWTSHSEDLTKVCPDGGLCATDKREPIEVEGSRVWDPLKFNTLEIGDSRLKNGMGHDTSYELVPMRSGTARHKEPWTQADFWITRYRPSQLQAVNGQTGQLLPLPSLPDYITGEPTITKDLVIWYTGSEHHENGSRDEDLNTVSVLWTGFELVPHNLFDGTPFYRR
jgi:hypothetical protein